ncbi:hypothetical protein PoB_004517700 [Plakobranchus ocellatus]|uniref:Uncharacterized protein n=1 Tax=Plakobranchus ocellatus TaxID=259542 RepID=A0AAV4BHC8_9GAST|nr:hypothetical protein PoB_004517700 [Plakobranchus ocellatus]
MHQLGKRRHICGRRFFAQKSMNIYGTDLKYLDNAIDQQQRLDPADETSKTKAWYKATAKILVSDPEERLGQILHEKGQKILIPLASASKQSYKHWIPTWSTR